ncbi:hypothetical protein F7725_007190 [Dissostichus mawsoni]|uniref:Zinc finger protein-like 1 n=1 Tax=Dissostichus mawsoni TaxID=36200 RepID=A0A7J5XZ01_DISMA|nr:hypothetical protein F7725_007190 [Dissostichus mawsoni]
MVEMGVVEESHSRWACLVSNADAQVTMGLCKCPKRKVTNLFCFEHRVNVCEHCLVSNHNKVNVFHWSCLNDLASRLPLHTAPAGYQCPTCQSPLFPPSNLASPIADVLKEQLSSVNWARAGLGLPLIEEPIGVLEETAAHDVTDYTDWSTFEAQEQSNIYPSSSYNPSLNPPPPESVSPPAQEDVVVPRKNGDPNIQEQNRTGGKRTSLSWKQRVFMLLVVGVLGFFTLIIIMAKLGRASAGNDPNLDPLLNPNIRVGKN